LVLVGARHTDPERHREILSDAHTLEQHLDVRTIRDLGCPEHRAAVLDPFRIHHPMYGIRTLLAVVPFHQEWRNHSRHYLGLAAANLVPLHVAELHLALPDPDRHVLCHHTYQDTKDPAHLTLGRCNLVALVFYLAE